MPQHCRYAAAAAHYRLCSKLCWHNWVDSVQKHDMMAIQLTDINKLLSHITCPIRFSVSIKRGQQNLQLQIIPMKVNDYNSQLNCHGLAVPLA
jgi:hypothetical protein